ncbi:C39 family peptidase [Bacillus sp. FJAT-49736]|uniref:C39 family peptidase n=1 Tax=Bacillus sp. FJAT-49736 TaxID=2833582 RepID=UPI001BCA03E3|nr:C39 family peptidase [Bacillus sp. FJAT-49736]MBS4173886.1 C39 family peptidase [Bacillus sp. FJAT-49736]
MKQIISGILCFAFLIGTGIFVYGIRNTEEPFDLVQGTSAANIHDDQYKVIKIKDSVSIPAKSISQYPELQRGCEVTSLAMLLETAGVHVDKMTLAKQIQKDPTPRKVQNGKIYFGDPNSGFVGNIYTYDKPGLGVYNKPIFDLGDKYLPNKMINLTGHSFEDLKIYLSDNRPIWVIINTEYRKLPSSYFQTWNTPNGKIQITYKEHSVLITGYDQKNIYFNDPLTGQKNKAPVGSFMDAWMQMGSQAITYNK